MKRFNVVVAKEDGGVEVHPMKGWLRRHLEELPAGTNPTTSTSHQLRNLLKSRGWAVKELATEVRLFPPGQVPAAAVSAVLGTADDQQEPEEGLAPQRGIRQTRRDGRVRDHKITLADVRKAHEVFEANEPRDLFYRVATELIALALRNATSLTVAEALAVLLQTWNKAYYQYHRFDNAHFASLQALLSKHEAILARYRDQLIDDLDPREEMIASGLFHAFEEVLGPVGAAKALHLMAPTLFPLWDRAIAKACSFQLRRRGSNARGYWGFLLLSQRQWRDLKREEQGCTNPLKAIDEYNYCKYTKGWLT